MMVITEIKVGGGGDEGIKPMEPPIGSHANVIAWLHCKLKKRKSAATAKTMLRRRRLIKLEEQISLISQTVRQEGKRMNTQRVKKTAAQ